MFAHCMLQGVDLAGTTFTLDSHVHPWMRPEFAKAKSLPDNYGSMTDYFEGGRRPT